MGGSTSRVSSASVLGSYAGAVLDQAQSCVSTAVGSNEVDVGGDGNTVGGVNQSLSLTVDIDCVARATQNRAFGNRVADSTVQRLADQGVALTQWMDAGVHDQSSDVRSNVSTSVHSDVAQHCLDSLSGSNVLRVEGRDNTVEGVTQDQTLRLVGSCLESTNSVLRSSSDTTNAVNQYQHDTNTNPLSFITDPFKYGIMGVLLLVFFVAMAAAGLFALRMYLHHRAESAAGKAGAAGTASSAAN